LSVNGIRPGRGKTEGALLTEPDKPARMPAARFLRILEGILLVTGLVLLGAYGAARIHGAIMSRLSLHRFSALQQAKSAPAEALHTHHSADQGVDFSLWSMKRIAAYEESLSKDWGVPLGVLRIPKIHLEVPVLEGTDDLTLNRGVGRISGTGLVGKGGNVGIAGHRDGFFRGLKDISVGDRVELAMKEGSEIYVVDRIQIVDPQDVSVLKDRSVPSLTLVTCYPFYFIGNAPRRYIVQCSRKQESQ